MPVPEGFRGDLVVRWPAKVAGLDARFAQLRGFPTRNFPRSLRVPGGRVWIQCGDKMRWSFIAADIASRARLRLPQGGELRPGYVLKPRADSKRRESAPLTTFDDPEHVKNASAEDGRFKYLKGGTHTFVRVTGDGTRISYQVPLGVTDLTEVEREGTYPTTVAPSEARLVEDWASQIDADGSAVVRWHLYAYAGGSLLIDGYHNPTRTLVEAKSKVTREAVRMAIGQLLDYRRFMSQAKRIAVLLPSHPGQDLRNLLTENNIAMIWRTPSGKFSDTSGGALTRRSQ